MIVVCTRAFGAAEENIFCVVDPIRGHVHDRILAVIFIALLLLLQGSFAGSERLARDARDTAVLAFGQIRCCGVPLLVDVDASLALKHVIVIADFGDKMLTS